MVKRRTDIDRPWWPVAERLRRARYYAGIEGQKEMADLLEVTRAQVNKWESGTQRVPTPVLYGYSYITQFDFDWLKNGDSDGVLLPATTVHAEGAPTKKKLRGRDSNSQPTD